ncbi:MAG: 2'-5' RNA ligase family protein [Pleurocapsa sp. SU_196_0]|nr:2'-5' RNA ligase family protein [Pleurocapsa sp. SU_196_0]
MRRDRLEGMTPSSLEPLILTARMEPEAFERFDAQRRAFFPPERNFIPAHVTLFHSLPRKRTRGGHDPVGRGRDAHRANDGRGHRVAFPGARRGVPAQHPQLEALRSELASGWRDVLTNQDRSGFKPHVTVQNKVAPLEARETLALLEARFRPWSFTVTGLELWRYLGGPWEWLEAFEFTGSKP